MYELNEQQQGAAGYTGGPSLITAGPGSGKTLVIVEKIRRLVESGAEPSSVLCMTFTEKAAGEMMQRLRDCGMPDVKVGTFHAFAKEILEDNPVESGQRRVSIFEGMSQLLWCVKSTDRFGFDPGRIRIGGDQNRTEMYKDMLDAISSYKKNGVSPQRLREHIDSGRRALARQDAGDPDVQQRTRTYDTLGEFNKVYSAYVRHCEEADLLDFDDIIIRATGLLEANRSLLESYRRRFVHVLVDELQDNNYPQMRMVELLGRGGGVTAVGDDDQRIMGFQGAYHGIFDDFAGTFEGTKRFELGRNYRSTKNIVGLANRLLESFEHPKSLYSERADGEPVRLVRCSTDRGQIEYVTDKIRELTGGGVPYRDVAVLSRRRSEGQKFARALRSFGIPAAFVGETDIFASPAIQDLISFLRIVDSPSTSGAEIFRVLKNHGISDRNLIVLMGAARRKAGRAGHGLDSVMDVIRDNGPYKITQRAEIDELAAQLDGAIKSVPHTPVSQTVLDVMFGVSGLYRKFAGSDLPGDRKTVALLNKFYEIAREFEDADPAGQLSGFLEDLEIVRGFETEIDEVASEDAVSVMTMHKSKGKEFPIVFVTDLADGRFPGRYRRKPFAVPPELARAGGAESSREEHVREERRLLYVSMTRAMDRLFLTYPVRYEGNVRDRRPSAFLDELGYEDSPLIRTECHEESGGFDMEAQDEVGRLKSRIQGEAVGAISRSNLAGAIHRIVELGRIKHYEEHKNLDGFDPGDVLRVDMADVDLSTELSGVNQKLIDRESLVLSPSSIMTYADCPLKFKYQRVMRVPQRPNAALSLGSTIHSMAERMAEEKRRGADLTKAMCMEKIAESWEPVAYGSKAAENGAYERAERMAETYLEYERNTRNATVDTEIKFDTTIHGIRFTGRIDRLEQSPDGELEVIDFKTGSSSKSAKEAVSDPQLNIYAKAVEETRGRLPAKSSWFYIEQDKTVTYRPTVESMDAAMESIGHTIQDILDERFEPTPSYRACRFCPYSEICDARIVSE